MFFYQVYGLGISCTHVLPYLTNRSTTDNQQITVDLSNQIPVELTVSEGWFRIHSEQDSELIGVSIYQKSQWFLIHFARGQETSLAFYISACGHFNHSDKTASIPQSDIESFLIGPVLGFALRLLNKTCLYASVLSYQEHALALLGPKGAGKLTTAQYYWNKVPSLSLMISQC